MEHAVKEYLLDGSTGNKSVVEKQAFEVMSRMGLDPNSEFRITEDGSVRLRAACP